MTWLDRYGYSLNLVAVLLWPLSLLFSTMVRLRRRLYQWGLLESEAISVPVIIVGNISVGGTGKTPLVTRLVEVLRKAGYKPGVVSRGYGGQSRQWPCHVTADSDPHEVGDEPVLLAQRCGCPVVVGPDRVAAAWTLTATYHCNVIISDDGLQHYRLQRDIEIAVIDGSRRLGNGACLPAGPLREPPSRLRTVDFIIGNGVAHGGEYLMSLRGETVLNLLDSCITVSLPGFHKSMVHAVAGIGNPKRFFNYLRHARLRLIEHPFPDHHPFRLEDLRFQQDLPVLMTEKDAMKCRPFASDDWWYVPVSAQLDPEFEEQLLKRLATVAMAKGVRCESVRRNRMATSPKSSVSQP
ncbi:MAG TPA: tetraacyldisaccharide 4'-kinase [Gammaproteobacteria bacterium]|mgnify:FL=1|nr:tetraacyldisaccharide 4'-kinase [Gammaproteobacteria bacterium]HRF42692.1 tetraacyldisaccharide 4'-kinase [Candidatus Competibacteraceae bacterium]